MVPSKKKISILNISLASGGAEKVISLLLKELVRDYEVTLILFYNEIHFPVPREVNTVIFSQKKPQAKQRLYTRVKNAIDAFFKYSSYLKKNQIDIAISFLAYPNLINGLNAIFNRRTIAIISERGFPSNNTKSKLSFYISKLTYPILYNRCDKLFSNSTHINNDLKKNFGVHIPMDVIYNPIELPPDTIAPETLQHLKGVFKIITAGTLNTRKNQIMVLRSLLEIKHNDISFSVLGSGHLENELKQYVSREGLENKVIFYGKVKNVGEYLLQNHCFVLSSFTEGFPNALLEAMGHGLPCISTNCLSGPLELLNDNVEVEIPKNSFVLAKYGILVNNDDHAALAKAIDYLRTNENERVRYGQMSLERAKDFELETIYDQFKSFIH